MPGLLQHAHKFSGSLKNAPGDSAAGSANGCFCCWQRIQRALGRRADSKETEPWEYIWVTSGSAVMGACADGATAPKYQHLTSVCSSPQESLSAPTAAFRVDNGQGTAGGGGAGGGASVSAAAASVSTPLVR